MKLQKTDYIIKDSPIFKPSISHKNGFEYRVYAVDQIITIYKEDLKSEKFEVQSFKII